MALRRGVVEWEALCRVRAVWVRVWWGAFCVPECWLCYTAAQFYSGPVIQWPCYTVVLSRLGAV